MDIIFQILLIVGATSLTIAILMKLTIRYLDVEVEKLREKRSNQPKSGSDA